MITLSRSGVRSRRAAGGLLGGLAGGELGPIGDEGVEVGIEPPVGPCVDIGAGEDIVTIVSGLDVLVTVEVLLCCGVSYIIISLPVCFTPVILVPFDIIWKAP